MAAAASLELKRLKIDHFGFYKKTYYTKCLMYT